MKPEPSPLSAVQSQEQGMVPAKGLEAIWG